MSLAISHFSVGVSGTMFMFHLLPVHVRRKMSFAQVFIIILGGLWAMFPDLVQYSNVIHYINTYWMKFTLFENTRFSDLTVFINRLNTFHNDPLANINYFHQFMDVVDKNDSVLVAGALVFIMLGTVILLSFKDFREQRSRN
ncbi:hypothetical protein ACFLYV_00845 [Chloroflexota bacterium]